MHVFDYGYRATLFCAIQFAIRSGWVLAIPMNSTAARSLMHGNKELKLFAYVMLYKYLKHVVYNICSSVPYNMEIVPLPVLVLFNRYVIPNAVISR